MSRSIRGLSACVLVLAAACSRDGGAGGGPAGGFQMPPTPIEVATVEQGPVSDRFQTIGSIEAGDAITVVAEIPGVVVRMPFDEGEPVRKGQLLAQLDDTELRAVVSHAEAVRDQQKASFERVQAVVDEGAGSPQDLDNAQASFRVAEADLALAQARLAKTRITAPFDGVVGARKVSPGAYVEQGEEITDLAQFRDVKVNFFAPERYATQLAPGRPVTIASLAMPDEVIDGTVSVVEPVLDRGTRSLSVWARFANPHGHLRPGMSANVSATLGERVEALTVPAEAVFAEGNQFLVYRINPDTTVARVPVTLGTRLSDVVEVKTGLSAGDRVVRAGHQKLYEGARVMPMMNGAPGMGMPGSMGTPGAPGAHGAIDTAGAPDTSGSRDTSSAPAGAAGHP